MVLQDLFEHSNWPQLVYTERELHQLHLATRAIQAGLLKRGIKIQFSKHFLKQLQLERGTKEKYTPGELFTTFKHILPKLESTFEQDPEGDYVFYDPDTNINIAMIRFPDGTYSATSTIKSPVYHGHGHKVTV